MPGEQSLRVRNPSWELFVLALTIVSLVNIVLVVLPLDDDSRNVVLVVDATLCLVFLADFLYRLRTAESKRGYMRRAGWLDLLGSLPLPVVRVARIPRLVQSVIVIRRHGARRLWIDFVRERAQGAMYVVLLLVVLVLEFASMGILAAERGAGDENIRTASDALWWGYVTITTVGYGDRFPVTTEGRIVGIVLLTIGVGLFGTFTAFIANVFLTPRRLRTPPGQTGGFAEIRALLDEHDRTAAQLRRTLDELEGVTRGASQPAPP